MPKIALNFKIIDFVLKCIFRHKEKIFKYPTNITTDIIFENINMVAGDGIPQSIHAVVANTDGVTIINPNNKNFNI
jgi:hypothetical protein